MVCPIEHTICFVYSIYALLFAIWKYYTSNRDQFVVVYENVRKNLKNFKMIVAKNE